MFERLAMRFTDSEKFLDVFLMSGFFAVLSILLVQHAVAFQIGKTNLGGLIAVLLTAIAVSYPFVRYMLKQERKEVSKDWTEMQLLHRQAEQLGLYLSFFLGTTLGFAVATFFTPASFFTVQLQVLESIRGPTGLAIGGAVLMEIVTNNLWVLGMTFLLTFFITSGIIFILTWNASVLGVLIGSLASSSLEVPVITLYFLPHGLLEIGGYALAGISGALLSYHLESHLSDTETEGCRALIKDALLLLAIAVVMVLVSGIVETV